MRSCEKCRITIEGEGRFCPLCQGETHPAPGGNRETFPLIPTIYRKHNLFFRVLLFCSVAVCLVTGAINLLVPTQVWWSFFVLLGVVSMWITLIITLRKRKNILKTVLYQVVTVSLLAFLWDAITGWHGWSLDYVLPIVCTAAMLAMAVLAKVLNLHFREFVIYILINGVFGVVPILSLLLGWVRVPIPSVCCVVGSLLSLAALFLFRGEEIKAELRRRLHL